MENTEKLVGKKILIVDDEPDILETLEDLLNMCDLKRAEEYTQAENLLLNEDFDISILDIMGVGGYKLLEISKERGVLPVMLTANAFSMADTILSFQKGAASYIPKERMNNITIYLNDILEAEEQGLHSWRRWLDRFADLYSKKFTPDWKDKDKEFWNNLHHQI